MAHNNSNNQPKPRLPSQPPNTMPRPIQPRPAMPTRPQDIRQTKEYKVAARRWTSTIVALPIVMYTSWILYERIYGEKAPKKLIKESSS